MGFDSPSHWAIVAVVVLVLFGYKKLPEMSRSVGRSLRIFKTEMKGLSEDDTAREAEVPAPAPTAAAPTAVAPTPPPVPVTPVLNPGDSVAPVYPAASNEAAQPPAASQQLGA